MRTFDALNQANEIYLEKMARRIREVTTEEEMNVLMEEGIQHWKEQRRLYKELQGDSKDYERKMTAILEGFNRKGVDK